MIQSEVKDSNLLSTSTNPRIARSGNGLFLDFHFYLTQSPEIYFPGFIADACTIVIWLGVVSIVALILLLPLLLYFVVIDAATTSMAH